jgi:hypothetical protein
MRLALIVALACLLCGCICSGSNDDGAAGASAVTTTLQAAEGDGSVDVPPALKYEVKVLGEGTSDPVLSIINKDDYDWHTCYILVNGEYSQIISEDERADVTVDVPVGGSFDVTINANLMNQYGKAFSGSLSEFLLDCDQGTISERVASGRKTTSG